MAKLEMVVCPRTLPGALSGEAIEHCIQKQTAAGHFTRRAGCAGCPFFNHETKNGWDVKP